MKLPTRLHWVSVLAMEVSLAVSPEPNPSTKRLPGLHVERSQHDTGCGREDLPEGTIHSVLSEVNAKPPAALPPAAQ